MTGAKNLKNLRRLGMENTGSLWFFSGSIVAAGLTFLFQALMGRLLGPGVFGALGSLLGLVTVVTLVAGALQAAITHAVASKEHRREGSRTELALRRPFTRLVFASLVLFAITAATAPLLKRYLHLNSLVPVLLFGLFLALSVVCIIPQAVLLGRIQFKTVANGLVLNGIVRCICGVALVELHLGLNGAILGALLGTAAQLVIMANPIRKELTLFGSVQDRLVRYRSVLLAAISLGGVSAFVGVDSVLARHYLPNAQSGYYIAAATAARIALFLPAAVTQIAFPHLTKALNDPIKTRRLLRQSLAIVALLGASAALVIILFSHLVLAILFGAKFKSAAEAVRILAASAAEMGILSLMTYFFLARKSILAVLSWIGVTGAAMVIWRYHSSPIQIATIMLCATSATLLLQGSAWWLSQSNSQGPKVEAID